MPTTVVTGANGFVGACVVDTLLSPKYRHKVIITTRSASSAADLTSWHPEWPSGDITVCPIADFTVDNAFDELFQRHPEIDYVVHVAAPLSDHPSNVDFEQHYERPNILGNLGLLSSAKKYG